MPYRHPAEKEPFDPARHVKDKGGSFVRKSALESDRIASEEAQLRNKENEIEWIKKSWYKKLFSRRAKPKAKPKEVAGLDISHEEALAEHVRDLQITDYGNVEGKFNGVKLKIWRHGGGTVDGEKLSERETKFLFNIFYPLVRQRDYDMNEDAVRKKRRFNEGFTEKGQAAIAKLFGPRTKELSEADTPPQLTGKPEVPALPAHEDDKKSE